MLSDGNGPGLDQDGPAIVSDRAEAPEEDLRAAEAAAQVRAMPLQRLLSGGMDWPDATGLHAAVGVGTPWHRAAFELGETNREEAETAVLADRITTARSSFLHASACFRFGQVPLTDEHPEKRTMYESLIDCFGRAGDLGDEPTEHLAIDWRGRPLFGWLIRPPGARQPPVVIQMGGFDGWREEYYANARALLERGIASLLVDGPGQGETRLFGNVYLDDDVADAFAAIVDFAVSDPRVGSVGIWGNSLGGFLAAQAASRDRRLAACCVNGGTVRPAEILDRFPRFIAKVQALLGDTDPEHAREAIERQVLTAAHLRELRCPLYVVHGTPDQVFLVESARRLYEEAGSKDKAFSEFPDGDHCIYNRAHERNCLIGDWFAEQLSGRAVL